MLSSPINTNGQTNLPINTNDKTNLTIYNKQPPKHPKHKNSDDFKSSLLSNMSVNSDVSGITDISNNVSLESSMNTNTDDGSLNSDTICKDFAYLCKNCGKNFDSKAHLKQHLNKKYKCGNVNELNKQNMYELTTIDDNELINELKELHISNLNYKKKIILLEKENSYLKYQMENISDIINSKF